MKKRDGLLLGAHMSISGGFHLAIERGESIGCTAIQLFTKSNRQWYAKPINKQDSVIFKSLWKQFPDLSIVAHASYLINIGSANQELAHKSTQALIDELNRCAELTIPYLIVHPGSHVNTSPDECLKQISTNLDIALEKTDGNTTILLETMAGHGTSVGNSFEQLATLIEQSHHKRKLGVCFDTCHAFAAGYDFRTQEGYKQMWEAFDKTIGLNKLHAIHINDSKTDLGSRVDRHADIGKGKIGVKAFELLFRDKRFTKVPKILETPYETLDDHKRNMETIFSLID